MSVLKAFFSDQPFDQSAAGNAPQSLSVLRPAVDHQRGCACGECAKPVSDIPGDNGKGVYEGPTGGGDTIGVTPGTASVIAVGGTVQGVTDVASDQDWFAITVTAGQAIRFDLTGAAYNGAAASSDTYLRLFNASGTLLAQNDDIGGGNLNSRITYTFATAGTYYISAGAYGSVTGGYTLAATDVPPPPPLTNFTVDQIADFLTGGYWSPRRWAAGNTDITFNVQGLTAERQQLARVAFATWADVLGITFTETTDPAEMTLDDNDSGAYASSTTTGSGPATIISSNINVATSWSGGTSAIDSYVLQTFIHEIGHALGLGHGGNYNGSATYGVDNHYLNDSWRYSIMSYFDQAESNTGSYRFVLTPQMADINALQRYYGASTARNTDTTYGFNVVGLSGLTAQLYNFANFSQAPGLTIFDAGGNDTFDVSGYSNNQRIDLNGGAWSDIGGLINNIGIYTNSVIENAVGGSGNDTITGNAANNILNGGAGNDSMIGGAGNDTYVVNSAGDIVVEAAGGGSQDLIYSSVSFQLAAGQEIERLIAVVNTNITLTGNEFGNFIQGGGGNDILTGHEGNDNLNGANGADTLLGGAGDDTLTGGAGNDSMMGGSGNDIYLVDSSGDQVIEGAGEGTQDLIYAFTSFQLAAGQEIERLIAVVNTNITLTGNELDNFIQGGSGDDRLVGNEGNDSFNGGLGNDTLLGGLGNDVLYGGPGNDSMAGGVGNDIFFVDSFEDQVIEVVGGGTLDVVYSSTNYQLADGQEVERLISLINSNVILTGNELGNFIQGGGGNDILTGHEGNDNLNGANGADTLLGGAGDDTLTGGAGNDSMMGGSGNDIYLVDSSGDQVIEGAGEGTQDVIYAFTSFQLAAGQEIERLIAVVNTNITLTGNELDNFIQGGGGNDILSGGAGIDTVVGGVGNDTFILTPLQADRDIFPDFNFTQDRFQVSNAAFGGGLDGDANGVLDANRFLASAAGVATTADQRFIYNTTSRLLIYDSNGNGAGGESVIGVLNASTLTAANFTVV